MKSFLSVDMPIDMGDSELSHHNGAHTILQNKKSLNAITKDTISLQKRSIMIEKSTRCVKVPTQVYTLGL